jgi:hypothetical protein
VPPPCPAAAALVAGYPGGLPARRGVQSLRLTRSSGQPNRTPDHSPENEADQRRSLVVGQRRISLLSVVASAETAHRRPRSTGDAARRAVSVGSPYSPSVRIR